MSISSIVTRGYGSWGSANLVVTRGYSIAAAVITPPNPFIPISVQLSEGSRSVHHQKVVKVIKDTDGTKIVK